MAGDRKRTLRDVALAASQQVGGVQGRALDREAKRRGLSLSYTTVDKIIAGTYNSRPSSKTLEALSKLSGVPLAEVYAAAAEPTPASPLADQLPPDANLLTGDQRRVVIDTVRLLTKHNRELREARRSEERETHGAPAAMSRAGVSPAAWDALREDIIAAFEQYVRDADAARLAPRSTPAERAARLAEIRQNYVTHVTVSFTQAHPGSSGNVG